ncbi:unnamed protein product [Rotaria sp. Silwood1]|nr:unnamed protein product [Rotaria sp. Silwood1]
MIINQLISFLFIISIIFSELGILTGDSIENSDNDDDDTTVYTRLRRQLKKFAYADPCEVKCVSEKIQSKVPIKVLAKKCKETCQDKIANFKPAVYYN